MKKTVLVILFALLGLTSVRAYDFGAIAPTGQMLYYNITSSSNHTVSVTYQHPTFYWFDSEPTGSLIIPSTVTYLNTTYTVTAIGSDAFDNCDSLTSVIIPNTVTSIGEGAFFDCDSLTSVTIPSSVTSIERGAFCDCYSLTSVIIPNTVTSIRESAFYLVRNIIYHGTASGSPWGALVVNGYEEGDLFYADSTKTHLAGCKYAATSVTIPNTVTSIGDEAFSPCYYLTSLTIPNTVTSIGEYAFNGCNNLANITIPDAVTSIGAGAFAYCSEFTSITIPNSVTSIEDKTFLGCNGLTSVTIGNSVTSIGASAFQYCNSLLSITIPNSVTSIGAGAFKYCFDLASVTIGNSVTSIGNNAFSGCGEIAEITSRSSVAPTLGSNVFDRADTIPVYIPCGSSESYNSQWTYFSNFVETFVFSFQAVSSDTLQGSVSVLQQPTCENFDAVLQAIPASGYRFDHWSNGETQNPYTLTVTGDTLITAVFSSQDDPVNINDVMRPTYAVLSAQGAIVVKDADGEGVKVFDVAGRLRYQGRVATAVWRLGMSTAGTYFVQIGDHPAQKVVVVR